MLRCQILAVLCACLCIVLAKETVKKDDVTSLRDGSLKFAGSLYKEVSEKQTIHYNVLISPLSIHCVLAMLSFGARATTAEQMTKALSLPSRDVTSRGYKGFLELVKHMEDAELKVANKIYPSKDIKVVSKFLKLTKEVFASEAKVLDFSKKEKSANEINKWVEDKTNHKIKDIIKPDDLSIDTRMVLVSALYFKGMWTHPFKKAGKKEFHLMSRILSVPMMQRTGRYNYKETEKLRILELPYVGEQVSMYVILPGKESGFMDVEKEIQSGGLNIKQKDFKKMLVDVLLPMFRMELTTSLNKVLEKMGMAIIFDENADFGNMTPQQAKVDKVIHKTFIEVNENGTEAAAATAVEGTFQVMTKDPIKFHVHQPFTFLLQHKESGQALFVGRCSVPKY